MKKIYKYKLNSVPYNSNKAYFIVFGNYGIKSLQNGLISQRHVENVRRKLSKQFKKLNKINKTKIFIRLNNWKPYTKKPMLSRMGKGSGSIINWKSWIKKGYFVFELLSIENRKHINSIVKNSVYNFPLKLMLVKK